MKENRISETDIIAELERLVAAGGDEGMTTEEIAAAIGHSRAWVQRRLRALAAQGKLVVGRRTERNLCGIMCPRPIYQSK